MRYPIKHRLLLGLAALAGGLTADTPTARAQGPTRPHIVHIVADDLGWGDVGFHGAKDVRTPNIDRLAATGTRLEQFYAQPLCTPTRASLMTGRYPLRYGLQTFVIPSQLGYGLAPDEWLLPQALKEAGYTTAIIGKWHLGHADRKYWPTRRGFDHQYGFHGDEIDYFRHEVNGVPDWYRDDVPLEEEGYSTTLLGDEAVRLIASHDPSRPLYLYLAFNAPHTPYQAPEEYLDRFNGIDDPVRRTYIAMVGALDDQVGRVLDALEKKQLRDRTLVLFHSDNGGVTDAETAGEEPAPKAVASNGPYRGGKGTVYEGGTRVVALASWPGHVRAGAVADGVIHAAALHPTLLALAGGRTSRGKPLDGMDVWGTIAGGRPSPRKEVVYNVEPSAAGVREGDWKLAWHAQLPSSVELFNIAEDPFEERDVAARRPEKVAELQKRANGLAASMATPLFVPAELKAILSLPPDFPRPDH